MRKAKIYLRRTIKCKKEKAVLIEVKKETRFIQKVIAKIKSLLKK
ncbi:unknown [Clostridium sp. CAG:571]|nr:unknown [Clostridium sp. CAG:571]HJJ07149.1 hypothetical protein [Clostridiaceae bacterium]